MGGSGAPRLVVADANLLVVKGLRDLLESDGRFRVVDACASGSTALLALDERRADVAVLGWRLADMTAGDLLEALKGQGGPHPVVVLSSESSPSILRRAVRLGAMGFCWQSDEPEVVVETVATVARGRMSLPLLDVARIHDTPLSGLTPRERDLLRALADGWSNGQIAARFGISENTVKYHLKNTYDKLGVKNRAMAIALWVSEARDEG